LGFTTPFAVLSGASVTNTGPTVVDGDMGTGGTSMTGFPPGVFTGSEKIGSEATTPLSDANSAYNAIAARAGAIDLTGQDLGGMTLGPGTYKSSSSAALTRTLTLAGTGSSSDAWYFQIGSTLVTATGAGVVMTRGALPCNVWWQFGSSATLELQVRSLEMFLLLRLSL
jgi:hypothetical protein